MATTDAGEDLINALRARQTELERLNTELRQRIALLEGTHEGTPDFAQESLGVVERSIFDIIVEHAQVHLAYLDAGFNFVKANAAYARRAGVSLHDLLDRNYFDIFPHSDLRPVLERARSSGATITLQARPLQESASPGLDTTYWDWSIVPAKAADGSIQGFVISLLDVSAREQDRRRLQTRAQDLEVEVAQRTTDLRDSEAYLRAIFDNAALGIGIADREWKLIDSNPALQSMLGYCAEELHGMPVDDFTHPDDIEETRALSAELVRGERQTYQIEKRYVRKDGEVIWVRLSVSHLPETWHQSHFAIGVAEDITERKTAQEALLRAERLASTGRMAAVLAHEINNPLQGVIGFLALAQESLADGDDISELLDTATKELDRAAEVVAQLANVNRSPPMARRALCDIADVMATVLNLTEKQRRDHDVDLIYHPGREPIHINGVSNQVEQVLLNLTINAIEAMENGGQLDVAIEPTRRPDGVAVSISDTGGGVPEEIRPHLFEPFYTTKANGLDLGLYVTQGIVRAHGGHIEVHSRPGEGATFCVWLPQQARARQEEML